MENGDSIRKIVRHHRRISEKEKPNAYYPVNRHDASEYFNMHKAWRKKVGVLFASLHEKGQEVVHVDICGRATARSMGADKSYCFMLKGPEFRINDNPKEIFIEGDLFNSDDFYKLIRKLKEDGARPALITFEPIVGLQSHMYEFDNKAVPNYKDVTFAELTKRLEALISIVVPGGLIYIAKPFQFMPNDMAEFVRGTPQTENNFARFMKAFAVARGCTIEAEAGIGGPYFLLRKPVRWKKKVLTPP